MKIDTDAEIAARIRSNATQIAMDMRELVARGWSPSVEFRATLAFANGVVSEWKPVVTITRGKPEHL